MRFVFTIPQNRSRFCFLAQQVKWDYHEIKYSPVSILMGLRAHELRQSIDDNMTPPMSKANESSDDLEPSCLVLPLFSITF